MKTTLTDLTARRFGRLTAISRSCNINGRVAWLCRCDCGVETTVIGNKLQQGRTVSCGCRRRDILNNMSNVGKSNATHKGTGTPEFRTWTGMKTRCFNVRSQDYEQYGGRGITVCDRWLSFETFLADLGPRPTPQHSIDRINNDGNYEPGNCRWATKKEQSRNQSTSRILSLNGRSQSVAAWAEEVGMKADTLRHRLDRGQTLTEALSKPVAIGGQMNQ